VIYTTTIRIKLLYKLALLVHEHAYSWAPAAWKWGELR
jgi:hypothetical protein